MTPADKYSVVVKVNIGEGQAVSQALKLWHGVALWGGGRLAHARGFNCVFSGVMKCPPFEHKLAVSGLSPPGTG